MPIHLVTGASGFLGGYVARELSSRDERVRALVRKTSDVSGLAHSSIEITYGDLEDEDSLTAAIDGVDDVYHCAGYVSDWGTWDDYRRVNVTGLQLLLRVLSRSRITKLVHVSTSGVYGHPNAPVNESCPHKLRGFPYIDTKIMGEELVWDFFRLYQIPTTVIRPVSIIGPGSITLVKDIADHLVSGSMVYIGSGQTDAGLAYVSNVVDLMVLAAQSDTSIGQAYNASDGNGITWRQYVQELAAMLAVREPWIRIPYRMAYATGWLMEQTYRRFGMTGRPLLTRNAVELLGTNQSFPIEKAKTELGFAPKVSFREGIEHIRGWLRDEGYQTH